MLESKAKPRADLVNILHVDDDLSLLDTSKLMLNEISNNFAIDFALGVDEALYKLANKKYDVVISDYEMPLKDGLNLLKELKEKGTDLAFILFTGKGREEIAIQALNMGADGYYNKQGSPETVYGELAYGILHTVMRKRAEAKLHESELITQKIITSTPNLIYVYDLKEKRNVYANRELIDFLGYSAEQVQAMGPNLFSNLLHPDDAKSVAAHHAHFVNGSDNAIYELEYRMKHSNGQWRWLHSHDILFSKAKDGKGKQILGSCVDITERKKAEQVLLSSEENFKAYLESSPVAIFVANNDGRYEYANSAALKLLEYSRSEIKQMYVYQVVPKEEIPRRRFNQLKEKGYLAEEMQLKRKNGTLVDVFLSANKLPDGKLVAYCQDITEHKKAEDAIKQQEITQSKKAQLELETRYELLERFADSLDSGLIIIGKDYRVIWINSILAKAGFRPNQKCYETVKRESVCPDCGVRKIFEGNSLFDVHEHKITDAKGEALFLELRATPLRDQKGNVTSAIELVVPITERKMIEEKLVESETKYKALFEHAGDYIFLLEVTGNQIPIIRDANVSALRIHGYTKEEVINQPLTIIDKELTAEKAQQRMQHISHKTPFTFEVRHQRKDGSTFDVEVHARTVLVGERTFMIAIERDITERKKTEEALRNSQEAYKNLAETLPAIVFETDVEGRLTYVNEKGFEITGYTREDLEKGAYNFDFVAPVDLARAKKNFTESIVKPTAIPNEYSIVKRDGTLLPVAIKSIPIRIGNKTIGIRGIIFDLTERKKLEREMEAINEKLRVIGSLTRHDVGNKLTTARTNLYLLKKKLGENPELQKYLDAADSAIDQSVAIFDFNQLYQHIGVEELTPVNVATCFDEAIKLLPNKDIQASNEVEGLMVTADSMLSRLFYNLIDNSLKHGKTVSKIRLSYAQNDKETMLIYEDNGIGILQENKSKIFSGSFTTGGSGLGLKLVKRMIEVYGWAITEEGTTNQGAKFVLHIPK